MQTPSQQQRAVSALAVLLLHVLLLFALLHFLVKPQSARLPSAERLLEFIINTPKVSPPIPMPDRPRQRQTPVRAQLGGEPSGAMPSFAPPARTPDISGFGQALLGCAPENLANLTSEQRAHCPGGFSRPDDSAVIEPSSHVKDPVRRGAEMRAKNSGARVPCTSIVAAPVGGGTVAAPMVDPLCVMRGAAEGFDPLNGLSK